SELIKLFWQPTRPKMERVIIGVTFFLGVGLGVVAVVALFTKRRDGKGRLKLPGIELSGTGAPILFLLVAAVLVMSGFGWASSQEEVVVCGQERAEAVRAKIEVAREAAKLEASLTKQAALNRELTARVSPAVLKNLWQTRPDLGKLQRRHGSIVPGMDATVRIPCPKLR
ncbi:MAG: hypothetical protein ACE5MH_04410, partial [Terriglobia bacterium]